MEQNKDQSGAATRKSFHDQLSAVMPPVPSDFGITQDKEARQYASAYHAHHEKHFGAAVRGEAVADSELALAELASEAHSNGNDWNFLIAPLVERVRAGFVSARAADAPSEPSDLSHRLRETADKQPGWKPLLDAAAEEIERYYGGMLAWKKTAEKKDRDYNNERMDRINERCKSRAALDSQPTEPDGLPPLPEPIEVGGEGWDFDDFKSEKTFSCEHMWAYARAAIASSQPTDGGVRK